MSENSKYDWIDSFCLGFKSAKYDYKEEWSAGRYTIADKMFVMRGGDKTCRPIITLKLQPHNGEFYRSQYEDVIPGYYMNKTHWNSIYLDRSFPDDILKDMIAESYQLVLSSFSKKRQREILNNE